MGGRNWRRGPLVPCYTVEMSLTYRDAELDDAAAYCALYVLIHPYEVVTPAGIHHWWTTEPPNARRRTMVVESDGVVVAIGSASFDTWTSEVGTATVSARVHPEHRRAGIGAQLFDELIGHLTANDARLVRGWSTDDPDTLAWCLHRGFTRSHEIRFSSLDLNDPGILPPVPMLPVGARVASAAESGPEAVYPVDAAAIADEPGDVPSDQVPYDQWLADVWQSPETDLDLSTVVLIDDVPAAWTRAVTDRLTHRVWAGGTGTLREHRGKGLAKIAKSVALRRAAEAGITAAFASNDETNAAMLAVNTWLGYRPCATQWSQIKTLGASV
jgi:GNAT superfamily N-acetyltransferase